MEVIYFQILLNDVIFYLQHVCNVVLYVLIKKGIFANKKNEYNLDRRLQRCCLIKSLCTYSYSYSLTIHALLLTIHALLLTIYSLLLTFHVLFEYSAVLCILIIMTYKNLPSIPLTLLTARLHRLTGGGVSHRLKPGQIITVIIISK